MRPSLIVAALAAVVCAWQERPIGPPPGPAGSFGEEHAWDDGKAELCVYDAEEIVDGEKRSFEAISVVAAELLDPAQMVRKDEFSLASVPVLKLNWLLSIPTGVDRRQQMASLFLRRSDLLAMKAVFTSQEWSGTTFAEWRRDKPGVEVRSCFDGEADQTQPLDHLSENELFYEQLPLWVRGRRPDVARLEKIALLAKRIGTSRCAPPKLAPAQLWFDGVKQAGDAKRIEVRLVVEQKSDVIVLAPEFPYAMTEWRRADGTTWKLRKTTRLDYWNYSKNEFAGYLATR